MRLYSRNCHHYVEKYREALRGYARQEILRSPDNVPEVAKSPSGIISDTAVLSLHLHGHVSNVK